MSMAKRSRSRPEIPPEKRSWPAVIIISGPDPESRKRFPQAPRDEDA